METWWSPSALTQVTPLSGQLYFELQNNLSMLEPLAVLTLLTVPTVIVKNSEGILQLKTELLTHWGDLR